MLKRTMGEKIFSIFNGFILLLVGFLCVYPLYYVICASFSDPAALMRHSGFLFKPLGFTLEGYKLVLKNSEIYIGYANTIIYVLGSSLLTMLSTLVGGFCLSRRNLLWGNAVMFFFVFTMYFNGGLIPTYLINEKLGLVNSRWSMIILGVCSVYNMIIMRTTIYGIPDSIEDAARIDGTGPMGTLWYIITPLCKPTVAVIGLFCIFGKWSDWFNPVIYLRDRSKFPLQVFLRELLIENNMQNAALDETAMREATKMNMNARLIQYCTILVSTVPILVVYPFLQKYFASGIMVGAVKG